MRKGYVVLLLLLLLGSLVAPAAAIDEVTPTPAPDQEPGEVDIEALLDAGLQDLQEQRWRSAISNMDQVLEMDSENVTAYVIRGVAYSRLGRFSLAIEDFTSAIDLAPYTWDYYIFRGDAYSQLGDTSNALLDYTAAIDVYPFNDLAFARRAELHFQLGDQTAGQFDELMAQALGIYLNGNSALAVELFSDAIALGEDVPSLAVAYDMRGINYTILGDNEAALEDYDRAIEINPEMHHAYLARGIVHREAGDLEQAGSDFANRINLLGEQFVDVRASVGDTLELEMAYRRVYRVLFVGEAGQTVSLSASDSGGTIIDPLIALLDPEGNPIAGDDDFGGDLNSLIDNFTLPQSGTYTLLLSHAEGGYDFGFEGVVIVTIEE